MKPLIAVSIFAMTCGVSFGEEQLVREIRWSEIQEASEAFPGEVKHGDGSGSKEYVVVTNSEDLPMSVSLLTLADPGITATQYALTGSVSYDAVQGTGYLEMWNHFPNGGAYFSKTLGDSGAHGKPARVLQLASLLAALHERRRDWRSQQTGVQSRAPRTWNRQACRPRLVEYPDGFRRRVSPGRLVERSERGMDRSNRRCHLRSPWRTGWCADRFRLGSPIRFPPCPWRCSRRESRA